MPNEKWATFDISYLFNDQIHIVLQYIDIFQRMLHINKKQSYGIYFLRNKPSN